MPNAEVADDEAEEFEAPAPLGFDAAGFATVGRLAALVLDGKLAALPPAEVTCKHTVPEAIEAGQLTGINSTAAGAVVVPELLVFDTPAVPASPPVPDSTPRRPSADAPAPVLSLSWTGLPPEEDTSPEESGDEAPPAEPEPPDGDPEESEPPDEEELSVWLL